MQKSNKFFIGAIVGSTIGALTTLLFSTSEGKKIQKKLMKKFHELNAKNSKFMHHSFAQVKNKLMHKTKRKSRRKMRRAAHHHYKKAA